MKEKKENSKEQLSLDSHSPSEKEQFKEIIKCAKKKENFIFNDIFYCVEISPYNEEFLSSTSDVLYDQLFHQNKQLRGAIVRSLAEYYSQETKELSRESIRFFDKIEKGTFSMHIYDADLVIIGIDDDTYCCHIKLTAQPVLENCIDKTVEYSSHYCNIL